MIELEKISFAYGEKPVLEECSFNAATGMITTITGPNGGGKSTLALLMAGILHPQRGRIAIGGHEMKDEGEMDEIREEVGIVFENPDNQFITTSVERELAFGLENRGITPARIRERIDDVLERFKLKEIRYRAPHTLSGGEKQKVAIAATLAANPRYLILDEPTIFLDPVSRDLVCQMIRDLKGGVTIVLISQYPSEILLGDEIFELCGGRMRRIEERGEVFRMFSSLDSTVQFLHGLREEGVIEVVDIPPVADLCSALEKRKNGCRR